MRRLLGRRLSRVYPWSNREAEQTLLERRAGAVGCKFLVHESGPWPVIQGNDSMRKLSSGFSLIELLIVVAIIMIIAAIAIPNFMRSRMAANQASAVASLRQICTAEVTYASTYGTGYSSLLSYLGPPATPGPPTSTAADLLDVILAGSGNSSTKSGYTFIYSVHCPNLTCDSYQVNANPVTPGKTGVTFYYVNETAVILQNTTGTATSADSPLAG